MHIVYKFVVTAKGFNLIAMMEITLLVMDVMTFAKYKKDGIAKVDQVSKLALVFHILLLDHLSH